MKVSVAEDLRRAASGSRHAELLLRAACALDAYDAAASAFIAKVDDGRALATYHALKAARALSGEPVATKDSAS